MLEYKTAQSKAVTEFRKAKLEFEGKKLAHDVKWNLKCFHAYVRSN
jgi:hypothetical protein